ncbi:MAG: hypothetical protein ABR955_08680 [Verrucomicrobiota bacterium]|jgi:hypothetical protein
MKSADANEFRSVIIDTIGIGVSSIFAVVFFSSELKYHFIYGLWCSFMGLAAAFHIPSHHFAYKNSENRNWVWVFYSVLLFEIALCFAMWSYNVYSNSQQLPPKAAEMNPVGIVKPIDTNELREIVADAVKSVNTNVSTSNSDYIEGTDFTHKQLWNTFPFGYAIIHFGQNRIENYEIVTNGLMDWKIDLNHVIIKPNYFEGKVEWTIPHVSATSISGLDFNAGEMEAISDFKTGSLAAPGVLVAKNKPVLCIGTLNDNQRSPVFVIGYRIITKEQINQHTQ